MKKPVVETGTVIALSDNRAQVKMDTAGPCHKCGLGEMGLCRPGGSGMSLTVENQAGAAIGDVVTIGIDDTTRRKGYWLAYVLPVVMLLVGTAFGHVVSSLTAISAFDALDVLVNADIFDALFGIAALGLTMWWTAVRLKRLDNKSTLHVNKILNIGLSKSLNGSAATWEDSAIAEGYDYMCRFKEKA